MWHISKRAIVYVTYLDKGYCMQNNILHVYGQFINSSINFLVRLQFNPTKCWWEICRTKFVNWQTVSLSLICPHILLEKLICVFCKECTFLKFLKFLMIFPFHLVYPSGQLLFSLSFVSWGLLASRFLNSTWIQAFGNSLSSS